MKKTVLFLFLGTFFYLAACTQPTVEQKQPEVIPSYVASEVEFRDFGPEPFVFNIEDYTVQNETYRTSIWTGTYMQLTGMSIPAGSDMGDEEGVFNFEERVEDDFAIFIPAGKWHNLVNDSDKPLKVYSIYSPIEHPHSTVHQTQQESIAAHEHEHTHEH